MRNILINMLTVCLLSACTPTIYEKENALIGSYELLEWKGVKADGSLVYPYGEYAKGIIQYTSEGVMSMHIQRSDRPILGTDDYDSVDAELIRDAYKSYFSYYGTYSLNENQKVITHTIEGCKNPDWVGRELKRAYTLSDNLLTIRSDSVIGMDHILQWKRLNHYGLKVHRFPSRLKVVIPI